MNGHAIDIEKVCRMIFFARQDEWQREIVSPPTLSCKPQPKLIRTQKLQYRWPTLSISKHTITIIILGSCPPKWQHAGGKIFVKMSQTPVYSQWQTNLTSAQRLGIIAAIAVSSSLVLMVYANKKHRLHCFGPVDSPKDQRFKCPLSFLTCGVDTSNASGMPGSGSEGDPISPNERELEDATSLRGLSCPHNSGVAGSEMCLQCEERRFITILERSRMAQWSWCSPALSPAMATNSPPDDVQSPGAASTSSCASFISVASHYGANSLGIIMLEALLNAHSDDAPTICIWKLDKEHQQFCSYRNNCRVHCILRRKLEKTSH